MVSGKPSLLLERKGLAAGLALIGVVGDLASSGGLGLAGAGLVTRLGKAGASLVGGVAGNVLSDLVSPRAAKADPLVNGFLAQAGGRAIGNTLRRHAQRLEEGRAAGQVDEPWVALGALAEHIEQRHQPGGPDAAGVRGVEPSKAATFFADPEGLTSELTPDAEAWREYLTEVALELDAAAGAAPGEPLTAERAHLGRWWAKLGCTVDLLPLPDVALELERDYVRSLYHELQLDFEDDGKAFAGVVLRMVGGLGARIDGLDGKTDELKALLRELPGTLATLVEEREHLRAELHSIVGSLGQIDSKLDGQTQLLEEIRSALDERRAATEEVDAIDDAVRTTPDVGELVELIGRDDQERRIVELFESGCRLVTVTGPPGAGKTSLAKRIAKRHGEGREDLYPDGCVFVRLAPLQDGSLVLQEVAEQFRKTDPSRKPPTEELGSFLKHKQVLIVIDNCEHLRQACIEVIRDVSNAEGVRFLTTSRQGLGFPWGTDYPLAPLRVPRGDELSAAELLESEAVRLFELAVSRFLDHRGQRVFEVSAANVREVARICRAVAGLPLAIEIAAARVGNDGGLEDVSSELEELVELRGGANEDGHHETVTAAVEFSYKHLSEPAQRAFRRLAVFDGGWSRDAAASLIGAKPRRLLDELSDNSLVWREGGRPSYLEPIRQVAENLLTPEERLEARDTHRDWYLGLAERVTPQLLEGREHEAIAELELEHDNLRRAVNWSAERGHAREGLALVAALWRFWEVRGYLVEGRAMLAAALGLDAGPEAGTPELMRLRAAALSGDATIAYRQGRPEETHALSLEAVELARAAGDPLQEAISLGDVGIALSALGRLAESLRVHEECIPMFRQLGRPRDLAVAQYNAGATRFALGEHEPARELLQQGLEGFQRLQNQSDEPYPLTRLGLLAAFEGDFERSRELLERGLVLRKESPRGRGESRNALGQLALLEGDLERAAKELERAWRLRNQVGDDKGKAETLDQLALLAHGRGDPESALQVRAACDALRERISVHRSPRAQVEQDQLLERIRVELGADVCRDRCEAGRALSPAAAAGLLLDL